MPKVGLTDDEYAAVTALVRRRYLRGRWSRAAERRVRMAGTFFRTLLFAVFTAFLGGCIGQHQMGFSPDAYVGRSVAEYAADHGNPASKIVLSDRQSVFRWDTIGETIGPAIGEGLTTATFQSPVPALCSVRLTATTQSPTPDLTDWTIRSAEREGAC
jgi:hypothetical protein